VSPERVRAAGSAGNDLTDIQGVKSLHGAAMEWPDIIDMAGVCAVTLGIEVLDADRLISTMVDTNFVPAAGRRGLTALYDPVVAATMRERTFRSRLVAQVAAGEPTAVLEIGCGTGSLTVRLAHALPTSTVIGLDPDPDALARAREKDPAEQIEWLEGTAAELPMPEHSCDRVAMSLVLHHLTTTEKHAALAEAHRVLRPTGRLHIADWGAPQDIVMKTVFFALRTLDGFDRTRAHARGELPALIEQAGFSDVRCRDRLRTGWGTLELLSAERSDATTSSSTTPH
jgi:SAM-dependent methyltransferase